MMPKRTGFEQEATERTEITLFALRDLCYLLFISSSKNLRVPRRNKLLVVRKKNDVKYALCRKSALKCRSVSRFLLCGELDAPSDDDWLAGRRVALNNGN